MELKPCPFCGQPIAPRYCEAESIYSHNIVQRLSLGCDSCGYTLVESEDFDFAVQKWNTRGEVCGN